MVYPFRLVFGFLVLGVSLTLFAGCNLGGGPDVSGEWIGQSNVEGDRLGIELSLEESDSSVDSSDVQSVTGNGTITSFESGDIEEDYIQFNVLSGSITQEGDLNLTAQLEGGYAQIDFTGLASEDSIKGKTSIYNDYETFGGTFEIAKGEAGNRLRETALAEESTVRSQQFAAEEISELEEAYGSALYANDDEYYEDYLSVETAIENLENAAIEFEETVESTYVADVEQRESDNEYVQSVLNDVRGGKESPQGACNDLSYDRSEYSQFEGISNDSVESYREAESFYEESRQQLNSSLENADELLAELQEARSSAGSEAPEVEYTEADLEELEAEAETVRQEAKTKVEEIGNEIEEYEKRAEKASAQAVAAYDEMGIVDTFECYDLSDETSSSSGGSTNGSVDEAALEAAVSEYYLLVAGDDWAATYPYLDSTTQEAFTKEEWIQAQQAREADAPIPPATSASMQNYTTSGSDYLVEVLLEHDDGSEQPRNAIFVLEDGEFKRRMAQEDIDYLQGLL